ncbi:hypothetical protein GOV14_00070 [Candidatus Pacearchaeota archaeon]|nr:hypothetical protein [Candidatus Pacearchaeota archaeon]
MVMLETQLGKNGITSQFVKDIKKRIEKYRNATIRVHVLQSARESRDDVKRYEKELIRKLGEKYTSKVIGFTILLRKWRKARTKE